MKNETTKHYAVWFTDSVYKKLFAIQLHPEVKYWVKDKEVSAKEFMEIIQSLNV